MSSIGAHRKPPWWEDTDQLAFWTIVGGTAIGVVILIVLVINQAGGIH